jgi:biotin operon repressor
MGDLVLLSSEVNPVIQQLQTGGFEILGIHNHIIGESPQVMYVHFSSHGPAERLAQTIKDGLARTKTPLKSGKPSGPWDLEPSAINAFEKIQSILGRKGNQSGKVLQIGVARSEKIQMNGEEVPPSMGMATAMNFQSTGGKIAATGDFVLTGDEVNPVIKELQANGIQVTALHNHMINDEPRLFFLHFWVIDRPDVVANALKSALTKVNAR